MNERGNEVTRNPGLETLPIIGYLSAAATADPKSAGVSTV